MKILKTALLLFTILLTACGPDDNGPGVDTCTQGFDQQAMFQNIVDQLIIPAYTDLQDKVDQLEESATAFLSLPTANLAALEKLQNDFKAAYLSWQSAAQYEFGPAEQVFLRNSLNNFPVNTGQLQTNIDNGSWDFDQPDNFDKGFPALDYLLFGIGENNAEILDLLIAENDPEAEKRRNYLGALITDIKSRVDQTVVSWETYKDSFIANTGTADGSSLSLIINNINHHFELLKREKIGFPAGVLTSGFSNPEAVEAFYSGQSLALAKAALQATRQWFTGGTGPGLDDYLNKVDAQKNGSALSTLINQQFTKIQEALDLLSDPLSENIETTPEAVNEAYQQISDMVVLLKTDLPSVLCISITYIDNPSDSD